MEIEKLTPQNLSALSRKIFADYRKGESFNTVDKSHENLFALGFQACAIRYVIWGNNDVKSCDTCARIECKEDSIHKYCYDDLREWEPNFEMIIKPVMKYLAENHNPHTKIMVDSNTAELLEGQKTVVTDEFILD